MFISKIKIYIFILGKSPIKQKKSSPNESPDILMIRDGIYFLFFKWISCLYIYILQENNNTKNEIILFKKIENTTNQQELKANNDQKNKKNSLLKINNNLKNDFELLVILNKFVFYNFFVFILVLHVLCLIIFPYIINKPINLEWIYMYLTTKLFIL